LAIERNISDRETLIQSSRYLSDEIVKEVLELAQSFRKSAIYEAYLQGAQAWEHPISLTIDSIKLNGFIDLLGADFILDFKTDRVMQPTHHRFQLWAYAAATQKPTAHIAYLRHDRVHTFDSQALSSIHQEAESLIHSIQNGYFSSTPSLAICYICSYREICDCRIEDPTTREEN
jgi:ATP-dependent helicase/nuclease subunit A